MQDRDVIAALMERRRGSVAALRVVLTTLIVACGPGDDEDAGGPPIGPPAPPRVDVSNDSDSRYTYPLGPVQADTSRATVPYPLGPRGRVPIRIPPQLGGGRGLSYSNAFEVFFPGGTATDPNHVHQRIKDTVQYGIGTANHVTQHIPQPQPPNDPGGYNSTTWAPDPPPDGINPGTQSNADGSKSYIDAPGLIITAGNQLPARKQTHFRWELHDSSHQQLDCRTADLDLQIDANGRVTKNELTPLQPC